MVLQASDTWLLLYIFLFLGAYGHQCLKFMLAGETIQRWRINHRMWTIKGLSSFIFGLAEYLLNFIGISTFGFNVTSKVVEEEQSKWYNQGIFEFAVASPLLSPLTTAAIINLVSFIWGITQVFKKRSFEDLFMQMFLACFAMVNCWPLYEAMVNCLWRSHSSPLFLHGPVTWYPPLYFNIFSLSPQILYFCYCNVWLKVLL